MNKNIIFGVVAAIIILVVLVAFASNQSPVTQEKMVNKSTETEMLPRELPKASTAKLPSYVGSEAPIFPNSVLKDVFELTPGDQVALTYEIDSTKATPRQVFDYYVTELPKQGWKTSDPTINEAAGNYLISATKGKIEFRAINYLSAADTSKTSININLSGYSKK
jgi:hypothetical protein